MASSVSVQDILRSLVIELEQEIDELVEAMVARIRDEVTGFDGQTQPELSEALRASCHGNIRLALQALGGDREPPRSSPTEASEEARVAARAGVSLASLLHTYRVGHAVIWERMLAIVGDAELSATSRQAVLQIGSRYVFAYVDAVSAFVADDYTRERDRMLRSRVQRRVQLVRDVLGGAPVGSGDLGYDLDAEHVAVIAEGADADSVLHRLADDLARSLLTVAATERRTWGWLGSRTPADGALRARLAAFCPPEDTTLAFGEASWGTAGFRQSHEQALAAHQVAVRLHVQVVRYDDVALEAALLADGRAARRFAARELGPLLSGDERSTKLLQTLEAYLGTGLNASAAGALLGVGDRTIAYGIRAIEELLGRTVSARSAELAAALRLTRVFGSER